MAIPVARRLFHRGLPAKQTAVRIDIYQCLETVGAKANIDYPLGSMALRTQPYLHNLSLHPDSICDDIYPFNIPAVQSIESLEFHPNVTFFVGENGSGKSTLLEAIALAMGFSPEGGTRNANFVTTQESSVSKLKLRVSRGTPKTEDGYFLRAESFFNVATYLDEEIGYSNKSFHECSHGEAFLRLLTEKFRGNGLYLLDEPEAALSPARQLAAICAIDKLVRDRSQLIIATHSPILLAYPHAKIYQFDENGLSELAYEDTDHYTITRNFLNNPKRQIELLIE